MVGAGIGGPLPRPPSPDPPHETSAEDELDPAIGACRPGDVRAGVVSRLNAVRRGRRSAETGISLLHEEDGSVSDEAVSKAETRSHCAQRKGVGLDGTLTGGGGSTVDEDGDDYDRNGGGGGCGGDGGRLPMPRKRKLGNKRSPARTRNAKMHAAVSSMLQRMLQQAGDDDDDDDDDLDGPKLQGAGEDKEGRYRGGAASSRQGTGKSKGMAKAKGRRKGKVLRANRGKQGTVVDEAAEIGEGDSRDHGGEVEAQNGGGKDKGKVGRSKRRRAVLELDDDEDVGDDASEESAIMPIVPARKRRKLLM